MTPSGVMIDFHGEINEEKLSSILSDAETKLEENEENFKKSRKVYNILVDSLQNLFHHSDAFGDAELMDGIKKRTTSFILAKKDEEYNILAANFIEMANINPLKGRLDKVNGLDKEGLRNLYKEVLDNGQYSVHGGGGLGMIDIARKSGNKLDYTFAEVNDDYGLFILKIKV
jgi:hypothetical protein